MKIDDQLTLDQAKWLALQYINGRYQNKKEMYEKFHLEKKHIDRLLQLLKDNDKELFDQYALYNPIPIDKGVRKTYEDQLKKIIDGLVYGIDGRKFDLLDYYMTTKLNFSQINRLFELSDYGSMERKLLIDFYMQNKDTYDKKSSCLEQRNEHSIKKDQVLLEKLIIKDHEVTEEEKLKALHFIEENELPPYRKLYNITLRRVTLNNANF